MFDQFYPGQPIQFMEGLLAPIIGSNQYRTDFSEYAVGARPSDWTQRWATTDVPLVQNVAAAMSGKALRWAKTSASRQALSWDRVPAVADCEVLFRARAIEAYADSEVFMRASIRGAGTAGAETGYIGTFLGRNVGTLYAQSDQKYVAGASTTIGAVANGPSPNYAVNNWVWFRFRVNGTTLSMKIWNDGQSEPAFTNNTDSSISAAGWTGLSIGGANPDTEVDFFSVGINGDVALGP